jgi:cell wall-associated NlpC family hydrolase
MPRPASPPPLKIPVLTEASAGAPEAVAAPTLGERLATLAQAQLGQPYRYGGDGPRGFDCSGLVLYVHGQLGVGLPRTAVEQRQQSLPLDRGELKAGDLVFFTLGPRLLVDHVGIYVGGGRFVHAPRSGSAVRLSSLDDRYYAPRFAGGGRFWDAIAVPNMLR